jgi:hypothetical protein
LAISYPQACCRLFADVATRVVLSLHHVATAAALIGGGVAYFVGQKLRG